MNNKHYDQIDALKGFAILLVLLGHSIIVYPVNLHNNTICLNIFDFISTVHMPLFFVIAGFNFKYVEGTYREFLFKKIKRLLIPYFAFNLIEIIPRLLLSSLINKNISIKEFMFNMICYGGNYWFLYVLFIILSVFPVFNKVVKNNHICLLAITIVILIKVYCDLPQIFCISLIFNYLVYFICGVFVKNNIKIYCKKKWPGLKIALFFILWVASFVFGMNYSDWLLDILTAIFGILFSYYLFYSEFLVSIFKKFGKYSLELYLISGFILVISRTVICNLTKIPIIIVIFNMICTTLISYLLIKVFNRFNIFKIITGEI